MADKAVMWMPHISTPVPETPASWGGMLLVEASPMLGAALSHWFEDLPFVSDVDVVSDFADVIPRLRQCDYDFVVLPDQLAGTTPRKLMLSMQHLETRCRVIFLVGNLTAASLLELDQLSPAGMIDRQARPDDVRGVLRDVLRGDRAYTPHVTRQLNDLRASRNGDGHSTEALSARQKEVLRYLALGHTVKEVAALMHLSVKSIDSHKYRIMKKLNLHDRVHLARYAIREGLCDV